MNKSVMAMAFRHQECLHRPRHAVHEISSTSIWQQMHPQMRHQASNKKVNREQLKKEKS